MCGKGAGKARRTWWCAARGGAPRAVVRRVVACEDVRNTTRKVRRAPCCVGRCGGAVKRFANRVSSGAEGLPKHQIRREGMVRDVGPIPAVTAAAGGRKRLGARLYRAC